MSIVYYSQKDPRWSNIMYSNHGDKSQTIGSSGCGTTCFAMVASTFLGRSILPPETCKFAVDRGFRTLSNGTDWSFFAAASKQYGLTCAQTSNIATVKDALKNGALVVASMGVGHFTSGGHYILLVGINGEWIDVFDPNITRTNYGTDGLVKRLEPGKVSAKESVIRNECRQYWIFPKKEEPELKKEDADKVVKILQAVWQIDMRNAIDTPIDRKEIGRLADEVRKAGGIPISK